MSFENTSPQKYAYIVTNTGPCIGQKLEPILKYADTHQKDQHCSPVYLCKLMETRSMKKIRGIFAHSRTFTAQIILVTVQLVCIFLSHTKFRFLTYEAFKV